MTYSKDDFAKNWGSIVTNARICLCKTVQFVDIRVVMSLATSISFLKKPYRMRAGQRKVTEI